MASIKIDTLPANGEVIEIFSKASAQDISTFNGYSVRWTYNSGGDDTFTVYRWDAGSPTQLLTTNFYNLSAGDSLGVLFYSAAIYVYFRAGAGYWSNFITTGDTQYRTGGYVGLRIDGTTARITDFAVTSLAMIIKVSDTAGLSLIQIVNDSFEMTDADAGLQYGFTILAGDDLELYDFFALRRGMVWRINETAEISNDAFRLYALAQWVNETLENSEAVPQWLHKLFHFSNDVATIGELTGAQRFMLHFVASYLVYSEHSLRFMGLLRSASDDAEISEANQRQRTLLRLTSDTTEISDSLLPLLVSVLVNLVRVVSEVLPIGDVALRVRTLVRQISQTLVIDEASSRLRNLRRAVAETLEAIETTFAIKGAVRVITEGVNLVESRLTRLVSTLGRMIKLAGDGVSLSETVQRSRSLIRRAGDSLSLAEHGTRFRQLRREVADALNLSEQRTRIMGRVVIAADAVRVLEGRAPGLDVGTSGPDCRGHLAGNGDPRAGGSLG
jgi:hypothetical protein